MKQYIPLFLLGIGAIMACTPKTLCTADEIWVMHDVHQDWEGNIVSIDDREYGYDEMEERFLTPGTEYWYIRGFEQRTIE